MTRPESGGHALDDRRTRLSLVAYTGQALGVLAVGIGALRLGVGVLMDENGDAKAGVSDALLTIVMLIGLFGAPLGLLSLLNCVRIGWVLRRYPWTSVEASYEEVGRWALGTPNGQPTISFGEEGAERTLTLVAFKWRWRRFAKPDLFFAGPPRRGGVLATTDRRALVWAGRSLLTRFLRH